MACEMDLSCSESSADFSEEFGTPSYPIDLTPPTVREYRVFDRTEAESEFERLVNMEQQNSLHARDGTSTPPPVREVAVSQILQVGTKLNFRFQTTCVAVDLLDRFLLTSEGGASCSNVLLLELAAAACLLIAGKLEETDPSPRCVAIFCEMGLNLESTVEDLKRMEVTVLTALNWRTLTVTAVSMLDPLVGLLQWQHHVLHTGGEFELALLASEGSKVLIAKALRESCFLKFRPALLAAAACYTVLQGIKLPVDILEIASPMLANFSGSELREISECCQRMGPLREDVSVHTLFKNCRLELVESERVVRIHPKLPGSLSPTSTLHPLETSSPRGSSLDLTGSAAAAYCFDYATLQAELEQEAGHALGVGLAAYV